MLYPIGLHRLPAQHRQSAATLDTGTPGHPQTAPERTKRQPQKWRQTERETRRQHQRQSRPEIKPRSGTPEEPEPARQRRRRQDRQQTPSPTRAAQIEPEPESQKRGTVDHGRRRTEPERRRAEKERERRENDSKTPLFSPSHRTPADQPPEPAPHRQTWTAAKTPPFSVLLLWSMRNQRRSTPVLTIRKAGTVHIFTTSPTPKIWLCTLFSTPLSFSPKPSPPKHTVHQRYISLQI